jgi:site-specific recombinase XerD
MILSSRRSDRLLASAGERRRSSQGTSSTAARSWTKHAACMICTATWYPHADFVFLSERKAPLSVDGAQKLIERLGVAANLPFPIHAHMLRHAAGYALAARGVDTRTLQAFMGHRSIANTVVYTAVADKRIRNIWGK